MRYRTYFLVKLVVIMGIIPFFGGISLPLDMYNSVKIICLAFLGFFLYGLVSFEFRLIKDELCMLIFPFKIIIRKIHINDIVSIQGGKILSLNRFSLQLSKKHLKFPFFAGFSNVLRIDIYIQNRTSLIKQIIELNPTIKLDKLTASLISRE